MAPVAFHNQDENTVEILIKKNQSPYKEPAAGPRTYNKDLEEKGSSDAAKAKASPEHPSIITH